MSENHELRLKIDAAAAKSGATEFQAAINAVKKAVKDLERDSTGAFTKLTKSITGVGSLGKMKLPGVDGKTLSDLDSFAKLQIAAGKAIAATSKVAQQQITAISGLKTAFASARKDVDSFNASLMKVNSTLARQAQLSGQSKPALRSPTAPKAEASSGTAGMASSEALNLIIKLYNEIGTAGLRSGAQVAAGANAAAAGTAGQAKAASDAARAASMQERLQLAAAGAMRSATLEAARLSDRLQRIGDTSGVRALNSALGSLRGSTSESNMSFGSLRTSVNEFANATAAAKMALIAADSAQRQGAASAAALAQQNRNAASGATQSAEATKAQAKALADAARAASQKERLDAASAAAMRSASVEAARLSERLQRIGDTAGVTAINNAMNNLRASVGNGASTVGALRTSLGEFANATSAAKVALIAYDGAQRQAAAAARELSAQNKAGAGASSEAAAAARAHARETALQERLTASSASAMRAATVETARLTERLQRVGDTGGISALNAALNNLRATATSDTATISTLRNAVSEFATATTNAKVALIAAEGAERKAAAAARDLTNQNRAAASSAQQIEREMRSIAGASNAVSQSLAKATGNMRGLENAFSSTFQVGSLFRNLLGSITLGTFTKNIFEAGNAVDQFRVSMEVASGSASAAAQEMQFVDDMTRKLGSNLQLARDSYSKFSISSNLAGVSAKDTQNIFEAVSMSLSVLGKGTEDQNLAFLALEQMMSKGTVSSEELRRQLGERLPGAVNLMAKALGVTTLELNKLLKAGAIQSADALPKFANELQKTFGPGLQNAMKRAGFSLGTMQGELQRLMETVSQSGFMQVLADQFASLTTALQSEGARDAAQKLGEGFASMAKLGGEALQFIIAHVGEVGSVIKAVFGGIVLSQLFSIGSAVVGSMQQFAALRSAFTTWTASMGASTAAASQNATAIGRDTLALEANAAASMAAAAGARNLAAAKAAGALGGLTSVGNAASAVGSTGAAVGGLGLLARGLGLLGPIAMAASVALTVIPMLMGDVAKSADDAVTKLDAALNRAGVSFDTFKDKAVASATSINFSNITNDLALFDQATTIFMTDQKEKFDGLQAIINGTTGGGISKGLVFNSVDQAGLEALGVAEESLAKMGASSNQAVSGLMAMAQQAIQTKGSILEVRDAMAAVMATNPDTRDVLKPVYDALEGLAATEVARGQEKDKLVNFLGTDNDKLTKEFVEMATQVVGTGEGLTELHDKTMEAVRANSALAGTYQSIEAAARKALAVGTSPYAFKQAQQPLYDSNATTIESARNAVQTGQDAVNKAMEKYNTLLAETQIKLQTLEGTAEGQVLAIRIREYTRSFAQFQDQVVTATDAAAIFESTNAEIAVTQTAAQVADTKAFTDEVIRQYKALDKSKQTYLGLQSVMSNVNAQPAFASFKFYSSVLSQATRDTQHLQMSGKDLEEQLNLLANTTSTYKANVQALATPLINAASGVDGLRNATSNAIGVMQAIVDKMFAIADAAARAANMIAAVKSAMSNMFGAGDAYQSDAAEYIAKTEREIELKGMLPNVRAYETEADKLRLAAKAAIADINSEYAKGQPNAANPLQARDLLDVRNANIEAVNARLQAQLAAAQKNANTETNNGPKSSGGGGGKSDVEKLTDSIEKKITALTAENYALQQNLDLQTKSTDAAELTSRAMQEGNGSIDATTQALLDQVAAAEALNNELKRLAEDPIRKYIESVPDWIDATQQIKGSLLSATETGFADMFKSGKTDLLAFVDTIRGTLADVLAKQTVGLGLKAFGIKGAQPGNSGAAVAAGGQQAGGFIHNAMVSAAQIAANLIHGSMTTGAQTAGVTVQGGVAAGGQQAALAVRAAGATNAVQTTVAGTQAGMAMGQGVVAGASAGAPILGAGVASGAATGAATGGGGGGLLMAGLSLLAGMFSEGGYSDSMAMSSTTLSPAAFRNAPHYKEGTANTSGGGIPAVLHPNEAVIPLSRGRKIPVEMTGKPSASENVTSMSMGDIHISIQTDNVGDANQAAAAAEQIATMVALRVQEEMANQMRYGGMMNPRGR